MSSIDDIIESSERPLEQLKEHLRDLIQIFWEEQFEPTSFVTLNGLAYVSGEKHVGKYCMQFELQADPEEKGLEKRLLRVTFVVQDKGLTT